MTNLFPDKPSPRRMPDDLWEGSDSFQIPSQADSSNLLDDYEGDFFAGVSLAVDTPLPFKKSTPREHAPSLLLNLRASGPRELSNAIPIALDSETPNVAQTRAPQQPPPALHAGDAELIKLDRTSSRTSQDDTERSHYRPATPDGDERSKSGSGASQQTLNQKQEKTATCVKSRNKSLELPVKPHPVPLIRGLKLKHTVINGGITKRPKPVVSKPSNPRTVSVPCLPVPASSEVEPQSNKPDDGDTSDTANDRFNANVSSSGLESTQSPLMIGRQVMDSVTLRTSTKSVSGIPDSFASHGMGAAQKRTQILEQTHPCNDDLLTLSQSSPRKPELSPHEVQQSTTPDVVSPTRPFEQRTSGGESEAEVYVAENEVEERAQIAETIQQRGASKPSRRKNGSASGSSLVLAKRLKAKAASNKQPHTVGKEKTKEEAHHIKAKFSSSETDKLRPNVKHDLHTSYPVQVLGNSRSLNNSSVAPSLHKPTKPTEFRFELDKRLGDRKTEGDENAGSLRKRAKTHHEPVKTTGSKTFQRRGTQYAQQTAPVIPDGFKFSTEIRAKEREKFDEQIRAKQREIQRQLEALRQQKGIEEEREIKELRKRAVPKAHEIPDWYANMPKRRGLEESRGVTSE